MFCYFASFCIFAKLIFIMMRGNVLYKAYNNILLKYYCSFNYKRRCHHVLYNMG